MELKIKYIYGLSDIIKGLGLPTDSVGYFEDSDGNRKTDYTLVVETPYMPAAPECINDKIYCVDCGVILDGPMFYIGSQRCLECDRGYR